MIFKHCLNIKCHLTSIGTIRRSHDHCIFIIEILTAWKIIFILKCWPCTLFNARPELRESDVTRHHSWKQLFSDKTWGSIYCELAQTCDAVWQMGVTAMLFTNTNTGCCCSTNPIMILVPYFSSITRQGMIVLWRRKWHSPWKTWRHNEGLCTIAFTSLDIVFHRVLLHFRANLLQKFSDPEVHLETCASSLKGKLCLERACHLGPLF